MLVSVDEDTFIIEVAVGSDKDNGSRTLPDVAIVIPAKTVKESSAVTVNPGH